MNTITTAPPTSSAQMWKKIKLLYGKTSFSSINKINYGGKLIQDTAQIANTFATFFASVSATSQYSTKFQ